MDADDQKLFADALREVTAKCAGQSIDEALGGLGWDEAFAEQPRMATSLLFEQQGLLNATSQSLQTVFAYAAGLVLTPAMTVVLPAIGSIEPPGEVTPAGIVVHGLATVAALRSDSAVAVVRVAADLVAAVTLSPDELTFSPVEGMDADLCLVRVRTLQPVPVSRATTLPATWPVAVAAAQRALAHELVGVSRAMLRLARDHAVDRIQFGQPIASFQAVRHRLSDSLVAVEAADATAAAAWEAPSVTSSSLAKAVAGQGALTVARHAQQVLAGMGFTREHPLHRHVRRALVLDALFGSSRTLLDDLGAEAIRTGQLPDMVPL